MKTDLDDMCMHYYISRAQRNTEFYRGSGMKGTQGYQEKGCYDCSGFKYLCDSYTSKTSLFEVDRNEK